MREWKSILGQMNSVYKGPVVGENIVGIRDQLKVGVECDIEEAGRTQTVLSLV